MIKFISLDPCNLLTFFDHFDIVIGVRNWKIAGTMKKNAVKAINKKKMRMIKNDLIKVKIILSGTHKTRSQGLISPRTRGSTSNSSCGISASIPKFPQVMCSFRRGREFDPFQKPMHFRRRFEVKKKRLQIDLSDEIIWSVPFFWNSFYKLLRNGL